MLMFNLPSGFCSFSNSIHWVFIPTFTIINIIYFFLLSFTFREISSQTFPEMYFTGDSNTPLSWNKDSTITNKHYILLFPNTTALAGNACLVCGSMQSQREKWSHHVSFIGHRNPKGDWNQQPSASLKAQTSHPGDGFPHQPFSSSDIAYCESTCALPLLPLMLTTQQPNPQSKMWQWTFHCQDELL